MLARALTPYVPKGSSPSSPASAASSASNDPCLDISRELSRDGVVPPPPPPLLKLRLDENLITCSSTHAARILPIPSCRHRHTTTTAIRGRRARTRSLAGIECSAPAAESLPQWNRRDGRDAADRRSGAQQLDRRPVKRPASVSVRKGRDATTPKASSLGSASLGRAGPDPVHL